MYAVWVERIVAEVWAAQQTAQMAAMFGGEPEWPTLESAFDDFEQVLNGEPDDGVDSDEAMLRRALGLRGGRG